jgi:hypothetical protein
MIYWSKIIRVQLGHESLHAIHRRFQFNKRSQLFICAHNEPLSIAVRVGNKNCSSLRIEG